MTIKILQTNKIQLVMDIIRVKTENLFPHPFLEEVFGSDYNSYLEESFKRTGNKPILPLIVFPIPDSDIPDIYYVGLGMTKLKTSIQLGQTEVDVILINLTEETQVKTTIIDLHKEKERSGSVNLSVFRYNCEMYPDQRGIPGSRYSKIGKEMGRSKDRIKDWVILDNTFKGEGDSILESIFENGLTINQGMTIKRVVEKYPEKFTSEKSFEKLCDRSFDFKRLEYSLLHLDLNDDVEFELIKRYLLKDLTTEEFQKMLEKMGKTQKRVNNHDESKIEIPMVDQDYRSNHVHLIQGDNRWVEIINPFGRPVKVLVGSPPYGGLRLNGDDPESETGHNMTGREYGIYLSETYERYKEFMSPDGSIYVIIDDSRNPDGSHSCSLEHFVVEMEKKGFFLVNRYVWWKNNPQPRSYNMKGTVNGFEMIYRFVLDPVNYYTNPDLFLELDEIEKGFRFGCTNTDNRGNTTRGGEYYQSNLKKLRNTLDERTCMDIIKGNVQNPEDYFRQIEDKVHTSTCPLYLTSTLILESTQPGDLVVDIWNGVGGTMESSLLLQRDYIGIEKEVNYFNQSQRRLQILEPDLEEFRIGNDLPQLGMVG